MFSKGLEKEKKYALATEYIIKKQENLVNRGKEIQENIDDLERKSRFTKNIYSQGINRKRKGSLFLDQNIYQVFTS